MLYYLISVTKEIHKSHVVAPLIEVGTENEKEDVDDECYEEESIYNDEDDDDDDDEDYIPPGKQITYLWKSDIDIYFCVCVRVCVCVYACVYIVTGICN